jgi:hypothetical protein
MGFGVNYKDKEKTLSDEEYMNISDEEYENVDQNKSDHNNSSYKIACTSQ